MAGKHARKAIVTPRCGLADPGSAKAAIRGASSGTKSVELSGLSVPGVSTVASAPAVALMVVFGDGLTPRRRRRVGSFNRRVASERRVLSDSSARSMRNRRSRMRSSFAARPDAEVHLHDGIEGQVRTLRDPLDPLGEVREVTEELPARTHAADRTDGEGA